MSSALLELAFLCGLQKYNKVIKVLSRKIKQSDERVTDKEHSCFKDGQGKTLQQEATGAVI